MLNDISKIQLIDKNNLLDQISKLPEHIRDAFIIVDSIKLKKIKPDNIIVCGMGGSALPANMLKSWLMKQSAIPITIWRNYGFPLFSGGKNLVFAISYSGNTEETLDATKTANEAGCYIIGITSGGKLLEFCNKHNIPVFKIPKGLQPRASTGYLFTIQALILEKLGICKITPELKDCIQVLNQLLPRLRPETNSKQNISKQIALLIEDSIPVIYGSELISPIAKYWQVFFNENSKIIAWSGEFPEMNHNETVGWHNDSHCSLYTPIFLRDRSEHKRINKRILLTKEIAMYNTHSIIEVWSEGKSDIARMFSLLWIGEFASVYLACLRNVDPSKVLVIDLLKKRLNE